MRVVDKIFEPVRNASRLRVPDCRPAPLGAKQRAKLQMEARLRGFKGASPATSEPGPRAVAALFVVFVVVWSLYFAVSELPTSIHNDMAEAYAWGREFQLGYPQHPPFWAWICGIWFLIFPPTAWAFAILSCLNAALGLLGSWKLIGRFAAGDKRVAATALLALTPFYTFLSYKYNANSIFLSLWPWTLFFFVRSIDEGRPADAIGFGLCLGFALLSKYYAGVLAAACALAALRHPRRWRYFASPSPWISLALVAALVAPHLWWLKAADAPPVRYLQRISGRGLGDVAFYAATALAGSLAQLGVAIALVLFAAFLSKRRDPTPPTNDEARQQFLAILALTPPLLTGLLAMALRTKVSSNMMIGVFSLAPLLVIEWTGSRGLAELRRLATRGAALLSLGALAASPAVALGKAWLSRAHEDTEPRQELAAEATRIWRAAAGRPIGFVAGSLAYDNAIAFYSGDHPQTFVNFDYRGAAWVTPEKLAQRGLLSVCLTDDANCQALTHEFLTPSATRTELTLARRALGHEAAPRSFVVTVVPPSGD